MQLKPDPLGVQAQMWSTQVSRASGESRFVVHRGSERASCVNVLEAWRSDDEFCTWFNDVLAAIPLHAFRWETPGISEVTANRPFEFVVLDSPGLDRAPDPEVFAQHFDREPGQDVLTFANLGGDAIMVVPRPVGPASAYGHLGAFVRNAPVSQRVALWRAVGDAVLRRLGSRPVWLSTAGAGVSWLHVRLDDRPKYYGFAPFRVSP